MIRREKFMFLILFFIVKNKFVLCQKEEKSFCSEFEEQVSKGEHQYLPCESLEIYDEKDLWKICPCSVIEGHLQISFEFNINPKANSEASFPLLTEVTDYVSLYGVAGVTSVTKLFPNLAVIRGENLVGKYSVLFDKNPNLTDSFLLSIKIVGRGSVVVNQVDYSDFDSTCVMKTLSSADSAMIHNDRCQQYNFEYNITSACDKKCENNCDSEGRCCSPLCYGGCSFVNKTSSCTACRFVQYKGQCRDSCPPQLYKMGHFCVKRENCLSRNLLTIDSTRECLRQKSCPEGYALNKKQDQKICIKCQNVSACPKRCKRITVATLNDLTLLKGCNIIKGSLTIDDTAQELPEELLKESLESLREVEDFVWVIGTRLKSLDFLRNLRIIRGRNTFKNYSLLLEAMENLENILVQNSKNQLNSSELQIENGDVWIASNPLLCPSKIWQFVNGCKNLSQDECEELPWRMRTIKSSQKILVTTSGFQASCGVVPLEAYVEESEEADTLKLSWKLNPVGKISSLSSVIVSYRKVSEGEAIASNSKIEACYNDWTVIAESPENNFLIVKNLEWNTRYAFRIQGLPFEGHNGTNRGLKLQSDVIYGKTRPSNPLPPRNVKAESLKSDSLRVSWDPPSKPNGDIHHYILRVKLTHKKTNIPSPLIDPCALYESNKLLLYENWLRQQSKEGQIPHIQQRSNAIHLKDFTENQNTTPQQNSQTSEQMQQHQRQPTQSPSQLQQINKATTSSDDILVSNQKVSAPSCFCRNSKKGAKKEREKLEVEMNEENDNYSFNLFWENNQREKKYNALEDPKRGPHYVTYEEPISNTKTFSSEQEIIIETKETWCDVTNLHPFGRYSIEVSACQEPTQCHNHSQNQNGTQCVLCSIINAIGYGIVRINEMDLDDRRLSVGLSNDTLGDIQTFIKWSNTWDDKSEIVAWILEIKNTQMDTSRNVCVPYNDETREELFNLGDLPEMGSGHYASRIRAITMAIVSNPTPWFNFNYEAPTEYQTILIVKILGIIALCEICVAGVAYVAWRRFRASSNALLRLWEYDKSFDIKEELPNITENFRPEFILNPESIVPSKKQESLGNGHFGSVYEAIMERGGERAKVAVKVMHNKSGITEIEKFLQEAIVMQDLNSSYVLKLLGVVCEGSTFMTVLELMEYKDLRTLMTGPHRDTLSHQVLLKMVTQAADGLAYLCSKHLVHRDVAARNCLINASYTLKIADLGMAGPPCYEGTKYNKSIIVTRWMAPESLRSSIFTTKSDVWSFGVLLWEISTNCQVPYKDLTHEGVTFAVVNERVTLSPPETTIPPFLKIMTRCWQFDPESRPSFIAIVKFLLQFLSNADRDELENNSFYFSRRDDEINFGTPEISDVGFIDQSKESNSEASDDLDLQEDRDVERGPEVEISKSKNVYSFTVQENNHKKKFSPILNYEFNFLRNYKEKRRKRPKDKVGIRTDNNLNNENKSTLQNKVYKFKNAKTLQDTPINFCSCDRLPQLPLDDATVGDELHLSNNDFPRHTSRLPIVGAVPCQCDNEVAYLLPNPINISQYFMCQCPDSLTEREERILTYQMPFSTTNFFNNSSNSSHVKKCCLYYCNCNCRANSFKQA